MSTISLEDPLALEQLKALLGTDEEILVSSGDRVVAKVEKVVSNNAPRLGKRVPGQGRKILKEPLPAYFFEDLPESFWEGYI